MIRLLDQSSDPTSYHSEIYTYLVNDRVVFGYDQYNGYVNFYCSLESLLEREFACNDEVEFKTITKDDYDNDDLFEKWLTENFKTRLL